jgi:hypothetical protein
MAMTASVPDASLAIDLVVDSSALMACCCENPAAIPAV